MTHDVAYDMRGRVDLIVTSKVYQCKTSQSKVEGKRFRQTVRSGDQEVKCESSILIASTFLGIDTAI